MTSISFMRGAGEFSLFAYHKSKTVMKLPARTPLVTVTISMPQLSANRVKM